jgi:hypothetical protein
VISPIVTVVVVGFGVLDLAAAGVALGMGGKLVRFCFPLGPGSLEAALCFFFAGLSSSGSDEESESFESSSESPESISGSQIVYLA